MKSTPISQSAPQSSVHIYPSPQNVILQARIQDLLRMNGITCGEGKGRIRKWYRFCIYELDSLYVHQALPDRTLSAQFMLEKRSKPKLKWTKVSTPSSEVKAAKKVACQSLYVLGYHLGIVDIALCSRQPRYVVSRVHPCSADEELLRKKLLGQSLPKETRAGATNESDSPKQGLYVRGTTERFIQIGTDVEFVLRNDTGKFVLASRFFSKHGQVGYDSICVRGKRGKYPLVELRPPPAHDPEQLFNALYSCMLEAAHKIKQPNIEWLAGGNPLPGYPIGGHIHFSGLPLTTRFIRVLDNYLTLPLLLLESEQSHSRRPKYGCIGDVRKQFHGGFEYRTPPSWIVSPLIARGVLFLAKVLAHEQTQLQRFPLNEFEIQKAFYEGNRSVVEKETVQLWAELGQTNMYKQYERELASFYALALSGYEWNEYDDIRKAWHIPPYDE